MDNLHIRQIPRLAAAAAAVVTASAPGAAYAVWEVVPEIGLSTEADDNARLTPDSDGETSTRTALDMRLRLRNFGERAEAFIEPRIVTDTFGDARDEGLENDDLYLIARMNYDWESVSIGLSSNFRRESVLRSEIGEAIPDDPAVPDPVETGAGTFGQFNEERDRFDLGFDVTFDLSERTNLELRANRIDVAYSNEGNVFTDRSDFDDTQLSATLLRAVDERNDVAATVFVSEYNAARNNNATDAFGVEGTFSRSLSQTWSFELTAGVERTDYRFIDEDGLLVDNADSSFTFGVAFARQSERTRWSFEAGRFITPNSNGFLSQRNELRAVVRHDLTPRLSGSVGVRVSELGAADEALTVNERDYSRATMQLEWAMTERWFLNGGYDRVNEEFAGAGTDATSNQVFLGIRYRGLSRQ